jgi:hypothetical protein
VTVTMRVRRGRETYEAAVKVDGKMTSRSFATRERADAWHERELARGREQRVTARAAAQVYTVQSWAERWLDDSRAKLAPASQRSYRSQLARHVLPAIGHLKLTDVRLSHLTALYRGMRRWRCGVRTNEPSGHSVQTQAHKVVHRLFEAAVAEGLIAANRRMLPSRLRAGRWSRMSPRGTGSRWGRSWRRRRPGVARFSR